MVIIACETAGGKGVDTICVKGCRRSPLGGLELLTPYGYKNIRTWLQRAEDGRWHVLYAESESTEGGDTQFNIYSDYPVINQEDANALEEWFENLIRTTKQD